MMLKEILLSEEILHLFEVEALIKTDSNYNKVHIYNEIRALVGVVTVNIKHSNYLEKQATDSYEYSLIKLKYFTKYTPEEGIENIIKTAKLTSKIKGLYQFIPRMKTIKKIGDY